MKGEGEFMSAFSVDTIKAIVKEVNNRNIKKEDIVGIYYDTDQYHVLYYKD